MHNEKNPEVSISNGANGVEKSTKEDPESIGSHRAHRSQLTDNIPTDNSSMPGMDEVIDQKNAGQITEEIQDTGNVIKTESRATHPLEASLPSPPSPFESSTKEKPLVIPKSSASVLPIALDSNNKDESNRLEQLFVCPHCTKFKSNLEGEYQRHILLKHPRKPGYPNMTAEDCNR
ncbi:MAG: hypothetical protein WAM14_16015 [Candidatus Nitrosopolaris sp.]